MLDAREEALIASAVARGFLTAAQVDDGRRLHELLAARGHSQGLLALLVARHASPEQARALSAALPPQPPPSASARDATLTHAAGSTPSGRAASVALFAPGARVGPYVVERELARGGMGAVLVARHVELGRGVALKVVLGRDPRHLERFRREAQATARLRHPNIVAVHEVGLHEGRPFLVMDLIEGASLADRLAKGGPLDPRAAAALTEKLARALAAAHAEGVLHRDIKPANVLIRAHDGEPMITDFGLAKDASDAARLTCTGQVLGTPAFMPPEQASGALDRVGVGSDVYSLGATLYAMLCGEPPFSGDLALNVLVAVMRTPPPSPRSSRPEIDAALDAICLRCLAKDPGARFPTADALALALRAWLDGGAAPRRSRVPLVGAAALALALPLALGVAAVASRDRDAPPTPGVTAAASADAPRGATTSSAGERARRAGAERDLAALATGSAEQRLRRASAWLAEHAGLPGEDRAREVLREAGHDAPLHTVAHDAPPGTFQEARAWWIDEARFVSWGKNHPRIRLWSVKERAPLAAWDAGVNVFDLAVVPGPDAEVVVVSGGAWRLRLAEGGQLVALPEVHDAGAVACGAGGRLAIGIADGSIRLQTGAGAPPRALTGGHVSAPRCLAFSPDGRWLASGSGRPMTATAATDNRVVLWDTATGERAAVIELGAMAMALAFSPDGRWLAFGTGAYRVFVADLRAPAQEPAELVGQGTEGQALGVIAPTAHAGTVRGLTFLPDGLLRSASGVMGERGENGLRAWEPGARRELAERARALPAAPLSIHAAQDGRLLVGDIQGTITVWAPW